MPRPFKNRFISGMPGSVVYKPAGIPARTLQWLSLGLDEFETIRLLDYQGLDQEKASQLMGISRPTVTRIYESARKKIATALTEGKAICVEGGPVKAAGLPQIPPAVIPPFGGGRRWRGGRGRQGNL